ncbi:hypothetical protein [Streptococcus loxodontisalivarius]|uniref:Uncharacterized protein n=1 Tax=Streptococcus loxodontisalivarius TaxID=1349415 RepID=A0ABS2PS42_9STRE|nr:hypothetical protein [Streptococcus loxodontisalivarius]MBM7642746.1 hypothetical protein [Streptococcus loxodontisalivarius]
MVTDKNYNDIAKRVYAVEFGKENYTVKKGYTFQSNNQTIKQSNFPSPKSQR